MGLVRPAGITTRCPANLVTAVQHVAARPQCGDWQQTALRVADQLRRHLPDPGVLTLEERCGDADGYLTHLLHAEPDGSFSIVAMVWLPGQLTPVHDHVTWCVSGVLQGIEHEEVFAVDEGGTLREVAGNENLPGDVGGFAPPGDIHRVRNAGHGVAISLHIYGADIGRLGSSIRRTYTPPPSQP
jgi:predicted metal-dependent enzyme (double-stranded beta helix superfamily)